VLICQDLPLQVSLLSLNLMLADTKRPYPVNSKSVSRLNETHVTLRLNHVFDRDPEGPLGKAQPQQGAPSLDSVRNRGFQLQSRASDNGDGSDVDLQGGPANDIVWPRPLPAFDPLAELRLPLASLFTEHFNVTGAVETTLSGSLIYLSLSCFTPGLLL
jgi:hypothetical protein